MKGEPKISAIYHLGERRESGDADFAAWGRQFRLRAQAWREHGLVVARLDELPEAVRGQVSEWIEANYG